MHDYQLERLNTRSFEQLIQSLSLEIIGKQVMIFGDGPDGGREASFEGAVKYPEGKKQWDGYGIIQAKFRQIPVASAKENADWATTQLKAEFKKLKPRPKNKNGSNQGERYCPEFYVFATNLSLSPVSKKGGKDRVSALLDKYKISHGLKDYAIWDGDQIRRFLDACPGIRMTYAAWLLSSDVLAEVIKYLKLDETSFPATIYRFLASELLDDQYAKLGQGGYTEANTIPLSNVFVDLPVDLPAERAAYVVVKVNDKGEREKIRPTFLQLFFEEARQVLKPSVNPRRTSENIHSRRTAGRVVLIGGPGQGKTTVGQFACQLLRTLLLHSTTINHSPEVAQAMERIEEQTKELPKPQVLRYPLRIDLKKLAEAIAGKGDYTATSLLDFLIKYISRRTDSDLHKEEFRKWLRNYPWLLVLDGLDEVPASSNRKEVMDAIRDFVSVEAYQQDADLLILATTRPQGYSDDFDPSLYCHLPLAPLNAAEALNYGTKLAQARHPGLKSRIEELSNSLKRATTNLATVRLMESPLQVTIMLALIEGGGEPPEQRWKLFHDYYDVIYRREKERGTSFSAVLGRYEPDINWIHHRAGWMLQQRNASIGKTATRLTHVEFEKMVDERLKKRGHDDSMRQQLVKQIREAATDRLVFLVGNTANEIGFEIRSLQEYMAAEHCFDGSEACVQETIRSIAAYPYWRNVFLFVAGRIFFEKENLIDSLVATCERLNEVFTDPSAGNIAAGSRLALAMLHDGVTRNQPDNTRLLARCASRLFKVSDCEEENNFISLFQGEAAEVWQDEILKCLHGAESKFPYIVWRICLRLAKGSNEWGIDLLRTRFPWSNSEAGRVLGIVLRGGNDISADLLEIFKGQMLHVSPQVWINTLSPELPEQLKLTPLGQLVAISNFRMCDGVVLLDDRGKQTHNGLRAKGNGIIRLWADLKIPFKGTDSLHSDWHFFHAVSEFARTPTLASLAEQLSTIFAHDPEFELGSCTWILPWQILAALRAKRSGVSISEIINAVVSGKLGTPEDWHTWEAAASSGIKLSSLGFSSEKLTASSGFQGPVYDNAGWQHSHGSDLDFMTALTAALPYLDPSSTVGERLVSLCCFGIYRQNADWPSNAEYVVKTFIQACIKNNFRITRDLIAAVLGANIQIDTKLEVFKTISNAVYQNSWLFEWQERVTSYESICDQIVKKLNNSQNDLDVLVQLSLLPPMMFAQKIPKHVFEKLRNGNEHQKQSAVLLSSNTLEWNACEAKKLALDIWNVRKNHPFHLGELLEFIDSQGVHGLHLECFLLSLLDISMGDMDILLRSNITTLLLKLVERRPPTDLLPDPSVRNSSR